MLHGLLLKKVLTWKAQNLCTHLFAELLAFLLAFKLSGLNNC